MDWLRQLGRAIRNLARISRQNPIWAITALTLSPIALIRHLFRVAILFLIVGIVLAGGMQFVLRSLLGFAHLLTIAPTRTGKGVGTIIPNLIDYPGSVVCIDPKGENARVTARQRRRFGPVNVLDPFGVTGLPSAAFNPGPCALFGHRFTVGKLEGRQRQLSFQGSRNASRPGYAKRPAQRPAIVLGEDA